MTTPVTCLVTIHGIGFEQAPDPDNGIPGYADGLHTLLGRHLDPTLLSDDPHRTQERAETGEGGAIYVQSHWPPESRQTEPGLARLGTWTADRSRVDGTDPLAQLSDGEGRIAHIALVYSHLEDQGSAIGSSIDAVARAALSAGSYATISGLFRMLVSDVGAILGPRPPEPTPSVNLQPRRSPNPHPTHHLLGMGGLHTQPIDEPTPSGLLAVLRSLENDVASYVCKNDLRERVRSFVHEALLRLAFRDDVEGIVVNSHSQGTVVAYDVLRTLPPGAIAKMRSFISAGSPLRKYVDLFDWGTEAGRVEDLRGAWTNFWDPLDPVADPMGPPEDWRRGTPIPIGGPSSLFQVTDNLTGLLRPVPITDRQVDNVANSGGDLPAHNYWDNDHEFVLPLAQILTGVLA